LPIPVPVPLVAKLRDRPRELLAAADCRIVPALGLGKRCTLPGNLGLELLHLLPQMVALDPKMFPGLLLLFEFGSEHRNDRGQRLAGITLLHAVPRPPWSEDQDGKRGEFIVKAAPAGRARDADLG
jgi:hypothetical protein